MCKTSPSTPTTSLSGLWTASSRRSSSVTQPSHDSQFDGTTPQSTPEQQQKKKTFHDSPISNCSVLIDKHTPPGELQVQPATRLVANLATSAISTLLLNTNIQPSSTDRSLSFIRALQYPYFDRQVSDAGYLHSMSSSTTTKMVISNVTPADFSHIVFLSSEDKNCHLFAKYVNNTL